MEFACRSLLFFHENLEFFTSLLDTVTDDEKPCIDTEHWNSDLEAVTPIMAFTNHFQGNFVTISESFEILLILEHRLDELHDSINLTIKFFKGAANATSKG